MPRLHSSAATGEAARHREQRTISDKCRPCKEFEQACMAHFELFARDPRAPQHAMRIRLHQDFQELVTCGASGCHLCRCWANGLLAECPSVATQQALVSAASPIYITSPTSTASPLRQDVSDSREAHYFNVCGASTATMRLGGVTATEFQSLTAISSVSNASAWALEQLNACHQLHDLCTESSAADQGPTRLLHIRDLELVSLIERPSFDRVKYLALSYCWGGDQETKLFGHNRRQLQEGVDPACLSRTIQDAISVCRQLQIEYLWVDALCIVQGDDSDWSREASTIHNVYGGAYVTLSVGSSDRAIDGFLHGHTAMPVNVHRCGIVGRDNGHLLPVIARKTLGHIRTQTPPAQRGWIFQEELLSPRIIYWTDQGLFWSCCTLKSAQNGTTEVDALFPQLAVPVVMDAQDFRTNPDPLWLWDDMISSFSKRDFTIGSDKLPAVNGLASLIQGWTGEQYLWGFWKSRLPAQLLWSVKESASNQNPVAGVPTWSWAAVPPAYEIVMPRQASSRATFKTCLGAEIHLKGRVRMLIEGLSPLWSLPEEEPNGVTLRYPMLKHQPNVWAMDHERGRIVLCLDWRRPIVVQLDGAMPSEEIIERLVCFEISYIGFLVLEPVSLAASSTYRRIGCAQVHREASFFESIEEVEVEIV